MPKLWLMLLSLFLCRDIQCRSLLVDLVRSAKFGENFPHWLIMLNKQCNSMEVSFLLLMQSFDAHQLC